LRERTSETMCIYIVYLFLWNEQENTELNVNIFFKLDHHKKYLKQ
jgi:hypothetical protein